MIYVSIVLVIIIILFIAAGLILSRVLYNVGFNPDWDNDKDVADRAKVIEIDDKSLTLEIYETAWGGLELDGYIGLEGTNFTCTSEKILSKKTDIPTTVKRSYNRLKGTLNQGDNVKVSYWPFHGTPSDMGIEYKEVQYESAIGLMNAWFTKGYKSTCVIFVHGVRDTKLLSLGFLPLFTQLGYPTLTINYRNDKGNPKDPSGIYQYGLTEWADVEAAVAYSLKTGAENVILFGCSMGGGIVANFMKLSKLSDKTSAVILDSPNLNFTSSVLQSGKARYGKAVVPFLLMVQLITSILYKVNWKALDYRRDIVNAKVPILILHTKNDGWVPVYESRSLAEKAKNISLVEIDDGNHTDGWSADKELYEKSVSDFLSGI
ncbi:MAG TPA: hypothetical protein ENI06_05410 [Spirochaetales bacterium]|nr:hypothetical protein [Spirochaetales bacterium]